MMYETKKEESFNTLNDYLEINLFPSVYFCRRNLFRFFFALLIRDEAE